VHFKKEVFVEDIHEEHKKSKFEEEEVLAKTDINLLQKIIHKMQSSSRTYGNFSKEDGRVRLIFR
jgi:hypothetical protein